VTSPGAPVADGRRLATLVADGSKSDVWIYEIETKPSAPHVERERHLGRVDQGRPSGGVLGTGNRLGFGRLAQSVDVATAAEKLVELSRLSRRRALSRRSLAAPAGPAR